MLWKEILVAIKPAIINQNPFLYAKWEILDTNIYGYLCTYKQLYIFLGTSTKLSTHTTHIHTCWVCEKTSWSGLKYQDNRLSIWLTQTPYGKLFSQGTWTLRTSLLCRSSNVWLWTSHTTVDKSLSADKTFYSWSSCPGSGRVDNVLTYDDNNMPV